MRCLVNGFFRGMIKSDAYTFQKDGKEINAPEKVEVKFDEVEDGSKVMERVVYVEPLNDELINKISKLKLYQQVMFDIYIDIRTYNNKQDIKLKLVDVQTEVDV